MSNTLVELHPQTESQAKFAESYRAVLYQGNNFYQRVYLDSPSYNFTDGPTSWADITTRRVRSVAIEMTADDLDRLIRAAEEGEKHIRFREQNPIARKLYEEYITMYHLTRRDDLI